MQIRKQEKLEKPSKEKNPPEKARKVICGGKKIGDAIEVVSDCLWNKNRIFAKTFLDVQKLIQFSFFDQPGAECLDTNGGIAAQGILCDLSRLLITQDRSKGGADSCAGFHQV